MSVKALKILIVDDDALVRTGSVDLLEDLGHAVVEAGSGEEALRILNEAGGIDVVITDYSMPKMNGLDLARAIRASYESLPIIIASGYGQTAEEENLGIAWLIKPYLQDELARTIDRALAGS